MDLPKDIRERFRRHGKAGGRARARRMNASARRAVACEAALRRWTRDRFGETSFAALGLPGGEMIDAGLADLAANAETAASLLVSLAAPRLRREGVPLPARVLPDADRRLYRMLEGASGELGHPRYLAHLRQAASFADACRAARRDTRSRAK